MEEVIGNKNPGTFAEHVASGNAPSRVSSAIFLLLAFVPIFSTVMFGAVDSITWVIISIFWALLVMLWLAEAWAVGGIIFSSSRLQIPLIGLLLIGLVQLLPFGGTAGEMLSGEASRALSLDPYATRFFVIRLVIFLTFLAACLTFINSERRLRTIILLVIVFGAVMAFFGILQRLSNPDGIYGLRLTPSAIPFGPFVNQHHFAAFMQMAGGLTLGLFLGKDLGRDKKLMLATAIVVMGVAAVFTGSRGGLIGFLATIAFAAVLSALAGKSSNSDETGVPSIQRKLVLAGGALALLLVIFGTALLLGGNDSVLRGIGAVSADADVSTGRLHFWPIAIRVFFEHPIIGAGFDSFAVAFPEYDTWNGMFRVEQAHNDYLQTLADAGVAGFLCILGFIYLLFRRGMAIVSATSGFRQSAAIGSLAGCVGILIHSFFDFPLRTNSNAFFFLLLVAIATVGVAEEHSSRRHRRHRS
jgi:O-antigen ligase